MTTTRTTTTRRNGFSRAAGSTYTCDCCGRLTRHTGQQSLGSKTCGYCWDLAGIENEISDGHTTLAERRGAIDALIADCQAHGGDPCTSFAALLPTLAVEAPVPVVEAPAAVAAPVVVDAREYVQTIPTAVLAAAARGDIDLNAIARAELASRGLDWAGTWIGFPAAARLAEASPVRRADGRVVAVTVPVDDESCEHGYAFGCRACNPDA